MLPGKTYAPEDYLEIVWRRKWLLLVPFVLVSTATFIGTRMLPDRYRAESKVLIVPQRVPQNYVRPTVTVGLEDRLHSIREEMLSRTVLERIIQEFDLYPEERKTMILADVVDMMRVNINVGVPKSRSRNSDPGYFTVAFESGNPRQAMLVAERVASLFIRENMESRAVLADSTSQFLQTQLEDAKRRLVEHEKKLEAFRQTHTGRLPSEVQTNLQMMQNTQVQLQAVVDGINRDRERQLVLDRLIADTMAIEAAPAQARTPASPAVVTGATAAQQLQSARLALQNLELRLTAEHPDVVRAKGIIADLELKAAAETLEVPLSGDVPATRIVSQAEAQRQKRLSDMQAEHEGLDRRVAAGKAEAARLQTVIAEYRARVEAAPSMETEQTELMRDYGTLQQTYTSLLTKSQESKMAVDLERRQVGEQFKIIDSARQPESPTSPDRARLNLMGAAAGLGLGLALIALLEYRDSSFRTHDDVVTTLSLPVLALVPLMITGRERRSRRKRLVAMGSAALTLVLCAAILVWRFDALRRWIS